MAGNREQENRQYEDGAEKEAAGHKRPKLAEPGEAADAQYEKGAAGGDGRPKDARSDPGPRRRNFAIRIGEKRMIKHEGVIRRDAQ